MIQRLSHAAVYVNNQDEALAFYTEKLGFELRMDATQDGFRWLTVGPKNQKELEIILMEPAAGFLYDEETAAAIKTLISKGALGAGAFYTPDCRKTYEELKAKGVEFIGEPTEKPYGIEAVLKDNSGNWFSLTQPRSMA